ncbi:diaminopimelate decarboxylase [Christensenellaceae bacterium NSJ-44]|uniref:Diaminopimelate decarboxylase n=1 Tax=Luoshenia tenuis TaxID=2763654 RepID=A0A926D0H9_9FIRM|nr:diaminopimelate decarboxylase [Luoshenia tenuis]MBC8529508.1 diaminopimelate decarboxylase [Luoshenia tenuis]
MKTVPFTKAQLEKIVAQYPTPFHLYDERGIRDTARKLHKAFAWNKGYKEFFAVKALPNPFILKILREEGCGVDCSSYTELMLAESCGFAGGEIMFSANDMPAQDFRKVRALDGTVNLDDISHIDFLKENGGIPHKISCRFNPGGDFKLGNTIMGNPGEAKYGFTRSQLTQGFKKLMALGVKEFGLHAFLASNTTDDSYYPALARLLFQTAVELYEETGGRVTFINLSGGVGIPYLPDQPGADILKIGAGVQKAYEEVIVPSPLHQVSINTELGRFMTGPHGYLISRVIHEKKTHKDYLGLDASAVNLMRPAMYGAYHHITVMGKESAPCDHKYDVTGSLCENNDKFAIDRMLPKTEIGDLVVIHDTGAHGFAMGYNYNGRLRSAEVLLGADGQATLIRRAETPRDYFATFDFTHLLDEALQKDENGRL